MKFELEFPTSIYEKDAEGYDKFVNAFQLMLNRMANSHTKYQDCGTMGEAVRFFDEINSALQRISMYETHKGIDCDVIWSDGRKKLNTGNTENLLDAANMLIIEHLFPKHTSAKFKAQSAQQSPGMTYLENPV